MVNNKNDAVKVVPLFYIVAELIFCNAEPPMNGDISARSVSVGDSIIYTCDCGYYFADEAGLRIPSAIATCLESGEFDNIPFCQG